MGSPESQFSLKHSLPLQTCPLSDEQMVVVSLKRGLVYIKHFITQMERHAAGGEKKLLLTDKTQVSMDRPSSVSYL